VRNDKQANQCKKPLKDVPRHYAQKIPQKKPKGKEENSMNRFLASFPNGALQNDVPADSELTQR
jgi:hypothetical protein